MKTIIEHIDFSFPWGGVGLLFLPLLIKWYMKENTHPLASYPLTNTRVSHKSFRLKLIHLPFMLRCITLLLIVIALSRPQIKETHEYLSGSGIDIMLCMDVSASMEAMDFLPTRLDVSRNIAQDFVKQRFGDRIGVVVFSTNGFSLCPLTIDTAAVNYFLATIRRGFYDPGKTSLGSGIAMAINRLKDSKAKNKIIVLLSDGVFDLDTVPIDTAIALAQEYRIQIYTIGIGSNDAVPVEITMKGDSPTGIANENKVFGFNGEVLQQIAQQTKGSYYYARDKNEMENAYRNINRLERSDVEKKVYYSYIFLYRPFLLTAILFLFLELILSNTVLRKFP